MIVVCTNKEIKILMYRKYWSDLKLTIGKSYEAHNIGDDANPWITGKFTGEDVELYIEDDDGLRRWYPSSLFMPLKLIREEQLNKIFDEI
jgi:hypothetical protein